MLFAPCVCGMLSSVGRPLSFMGGAWSSIDGELLSVCAGSSYGLFGGQIQKRANGKMTYLSGRQWVIEIITLGLFWLKKRKQCTLKDKQRILVWHGSNIKFKIFPQHHCPFHLDGHSGDRNRQVLSTPSTVPSGCHPKSKW